MQIDFVDTMQHDRNKQRTQRDQRDQRVSGAGMSLLFLAASSIVVACYWLAMLFAVVFG